MPLRTKAPYTNDKSKSVTQELEMKFVEQNFRNMIWYYRNELLKVQCGKKPDILGLSHGEIGNLRRQGILRLTTGVNERIDLVGHYHNLNGRKLVLTEKARLILKKIIFSES